MHAAYISHLQHFSLGDGPGIRTTVFFKGCNLHCPWCHNPETISVKPQLLFYPSLCTSCGKCASVCGRHTWIDGEHRFDRQGCDACGKCTQDCPAEALSLCGERQTTQKLMSHIREDWEFYAMSGGGVTLSGGEALLQADSCRELAARCSKENIPVLLDTAGCVHYGAFEKVLPYLSLCYFDLKSGTQSGYDAVGGKLDLVLENIKRLVADGVETVARIPVIPGFNDTREDALQMADALSETGIRKVHLLPFHRLGSGKYAGLGQIYSYGETLPPPATTLETMLEVFQHSGFSASKGG